MAVKLNDELPRLYTASDVDTESTLDVALFKRHGTDPTAALLHQSPRSTVSLKLCLSSINSGVKLSSLD